jgi:hypothetical protein
MDNEDEEEVSEDEIAEVELDDQVKQYDDFERDHDLDLLRNKKGANSSVSGQNGEASPV